MANVFICPIEGETEKAHYSTAVETGVELETVSPWIRDEVQIADLRRCYPDGRCYVWGVPDRGENRSTWNAMSENDLVLGYCNRSIVSAATVLIKVDSPSLATALWGNQTEGPPRLMSFFDKPHVGEVPIDSDAGLSRPGVHRVHQAQSGKVPKTSCVPSGRSKYLSGWGCATISRSVSAIRNRGRPSMGSRTKEGKVRTPCLFRYDPAIRAQSVTFAISLGLISRSM